VRFCLDGTHAHDWLSFFRANFALDELVERWRGHEYLGFETRSPQNSRASRTCKQQRPGSARVEEHAVWSLKRVALGEFIGAASRGVRDGSELRAAGCVCVFRDDSAANEPFGMWFWYFVVRDLSAPAGSCYTRILDLQNSAIESSLEAAITSVWPCPPRKEVFYAPLTWHPAATDAAV
jgi:hypothetical protein